MAIRVTKTKAITGPSKHSPAGGVAPRTGKAFVGHAIHQHAVLHGPSSSLKSVKGQFR